MALMLAFRRCGLVALSLVLPLSVPPALAQLFCSDHDAIIAGLTDNFQEQRLGYGVASDDAIIEIYTSANGTWTVLMTDVRGRSCVLAAGDGWENSMDVVREIEPRH